jgi:hypothetical protein
MNVFAFDIETVPDVEAGRRLLGLDDLDDGQVAESMLAARREETAGSEFLRLHMHRVVVISIAARIGDKFRVWSIGEADGDEADILRRFFEGVERYIPLLVSWNGGGFDLPVLHYRSMIHGVSAPRYWDTGQGDREFRWNNYLNRFHERHTDLMDVLAGYQPRANAPLDEMATLCGLPGKMGMSGAKVREYIEAGKFDPVRDYCETDVLNTYLLYLRYELLRGNLDTQRHAEECGLVRETLRQMDRAHLNEFLAAWPD